MMTALDPRTDRRLRSEVSAEGKPDKVIQRILCHSNVAVTMKCYVKAMEPDVVGGMAKLERNIAQQYSGSTAKVAALADTKLIN